MSIFGDILNKIFHHEAAQAPPADAQSVSPAPTPQPPDASTPAASSPSPAPASAVDVGAVLAAMAEMKSDQGGNYQTSIVDLLKLLDLDSSLQARKDLAEELGVRAGEDGSAEQNIALHRAVMDQLAANGGIVPDSLRN
jgi:3-oxoacyl-ACP reductase-like protein